MIIDAFIFFSAIQCTYEISYLIKSHVKALGLRGLDGFINGGDA